MNFFDTHAHLNISPLKENENEIVKECIENGIFINNVSFDAASSILATEQAKKYSSVYCSVGIHPTDVKEENFLSDILSLENLLKNAKANKIIAIGETGLDFFYTKDNFLLQKKYLLAHMDLAIKYNLPLILHIRDAHEECYQILKDYPQINQIQAVVHCFDATAVMCNKYIDLGFYIGIGGLVTKKNKLDLIEAVKNTNIDKILSETDCPFLTPMKFIGQKNKPLFMLESIKRIAEIKELGYEEVVEILFNNALNFFKIKI
ncbi:MAG: TatD family hydrolase [Mycoplasmataceae bacterium]|jgi:TatD DNase family protein|nr:TatD family hydrolase [Mycoplasmataceae bacterium]